MVDKFEQLIKVKSRSETLDDLKDQPPLCFRPFPLSHIMRHPADNRNCDPFGSKGVGEFPDPRFPGLCLNRHHSLCDSVLLKLYDMVIEFTPKFRQKNLAHIFI